MVEPEDASTQAEWLRLINTPPPLRKAEAKRGYANAWVGDPKKGKVKWERRYFILFTDGTLEMRPEASR